MLGVHGTATALVLGSLNGSLELKQVQLADDLRDDEIIVRMAATGICHTDLASMTGKRPPAPPAIYGHEGAGVIEKVGSSVKHVVVGDHVVLTFSSCGTCTPCKKNQSSYCKHGSALTFGGQRLDGSKTFFLDGDGIASSYFGQSSFASRSIVKGSCAVKVDKSLPLDVLCCLGCGVQTGAGTVLNVLKPEAGSTVAIYGGGGVVGLAAVAIAAHCTPATKIIAIDIDDKRLEVAKDFGATHTINSIGKDLVQEIDQLTEGEGADYSIDTTGVISVIETMIAASGQKGISVTVGSAPRGQTVAIEPASWIRSGKSYIGCCLGSSSPEVLIPAMISWWQQGRLPLDRLIKRYSYADVNEAIKDMKERKTIKPVLLWE